MKKWELESKDVTFWCGGVPFAHTREFEEADFVELSRRRRIATLQFGVVIVLAVASFVAGIVAQGVVGIACGITGGCILCFVAFVPLLNWSQMTNAPKPWKVYIFEGEMADTARRCRTQSLLGRRLRVRPGDAVNIFLMESDALLFANGKPIGGCLRFSRILRWSESRVRQKRAISPRCPRASGTRSPRFSHEHPMSLPRSETYCSLL